MLSYVLTQFKQLYKIFESTLYFYLESTITVLFFPFLFFSFFFAYFDFLDWFALPCSNKAEIFSMN